MYSQSTIARFWAKVQRTESCFLWAASTSSNGYGRFWNGARLTEAHRFAYEIEDGPIPTGLEVDHTCRIKLCVKRGHLELVTHAENQRRWSVSVTQCRKGGHPLTLDNVYIQRAYKGRRATRRCRACHLVFMASPRQLELKRLRRAKYVKPRLKKP